MQKYYRDDCYNNDDKFIYRTPTTHQIALQNINNKHDTDLTQ